jgi:predicted RNA-binding Zn ribbon-like protein
MTGQAEIASYEEAGVGFAIDLVNALAIDHAFGRPIVDRDLFASIRQILEVDPPSLALLRKRHVDEFVELARQLRLVFGNLDRGDVDAAAGRLNTLLAAHPAAPHLAKEDGQWRLHHHPVDAALVPMMTAICAEGLARVIGTGGSHRLGTCGSAGCERVFLDESKNGSRRFCSTTCQNRVKAAAFRRRQVTA